jgi:flagellar biosynthesis protein FlhF
MRVKRFVARSLPEAMVQVKAELGPDAVILHTNEVRVGGVFGLFGHRMIQVTAAVEEKPRVREPAVVAAAVQTAAALSAPSLQPPPQPAPSPVRPAPLAGGEPAAPELVAVRDEMAGMKAMMNQLMDRLEEHAGGAKLDPVLRPLLASMLRGGVHEDQALALLGRVRLRMAQGEGTRAEPGELLRAQMAQDLSDVRTMDGSGGRVVALVGPTGVGKTTTLAKLAAHLALQQCKRVALITADTYRIAAVEQLRTYSEIIGVPLEVVYEPVELDRALDRYRDRDVILVDTAGRSPRNQAHMDELRSYLDHLRAEETYLVMSLTCGYRDAMTIAEHYMPLGFDRFLFTKWDEAAAPGLIYNVVQKYKRPLSYVTTGQSVPDDIEVADPQTIIRAILGD